MKPYPVYSDPLPEGLAPGLYIALLRGFPSDAVRVLTDGADGENGAIIGPVKYVNGIFNVHLDIEFVSSDAAEPYREAFGREMFGDVVASLWYGKRVYDGILSYTEPKQPENDCIHFDGMFYSDWTIFTVPDKVLRCPICGDTVEHCYHPDEYDGVVVGRWKQTNAEDAPVLHTTEDVEASLEAMWAQEDAEDGTL